MRIPAMKNRTVCREIEVRTIKSLLFIGLMAVLAFSVSNDLKKIAGGAEAASAEAENGKAQLQEADAEKSDAKEAGVQETERKRVALTFDDGPHPVYTRRLLDGLKQRGVKATFFVIGRNIPGNEELISKMAEDGHLIGNHTYDHVRIDTLGSAEALEQVEKTSKMVYDIIGKNTEFIRPPFGEWKKGLESSFVMIPVLWNVDPHDWTTENADTVVQRVLSTVKNGDMILMHDWYASSVTAALRIVDALLEEGYEFVTAEEMILE